MLTLAAWVLVAPTEAWAPPKQYVDLRYQVDPAVDGCLSAAGFRSVVAHRLGYDPHREDSTPSVEVRVRATETGLEGTIEWISTEERRIGERRFSSPSRDCHDMTVTMAFVVAVQTQLMASEPSAEAPESTDTEPKPSSRPAPGGVPPRELSEADKPVVPTGEPPKPHPAPNAESTEWSVVAGAGPAVGFRLGPHAVGLGRLFLSVHSRWVGVELGAEATLPSTTHVDGESGFRHDLILATLAACGSRSSMAACTVAKLGRIRVKGTGVDNPATPTGLVGQVGARFAYSLRLDDHLTLQGHLDGFYLLTPWTIDLNEQDVWIMPRYSAVAGIDLARRFP